MLPHALAIYLLFGLMHTCYAVLWQRRHAQAVRAGAVWVPVTTLLLMLLPVLRLENVSLLVWPTLLIVDLAVIALALLARAVAPVFAALVLTLFTTACWFFKLPASNEESLTLFLCVLGGFALVFAMASSVLARRVVAGGGSETQNEMARWLPVSSAVLPFWLLIMAILHLRVGDPSPVFCVALLLNIFLLKLGGSHASRACRLPGSCGPLAPGLVWQCGELQSSTCLGAATLVLGLSRVVHAASPCFPEAVLTGNLTLGCGSAGRCGHIRARPLPGKTNVAE